MKRLLLSTLALFALCLLPAARLNKISAQTGGAPAANVERILASFRAKETEFRRVLSAYGYKREAVIQSIGMGGQVAGEYRRISYLTFDADGNPREKIISFKLPSLRIEPEDLQDLDTIQTFGVEAGKIDRYGFTYIGRERLDELDTFVFDVAPKVMPDPKQSRERFFQGRIWIDDRDMQLVKAKGRGVPAGKQRFPTFETYREQIDSRHWFPSVTLADDHLTLQNGQDLHLRIRVRFTDYENPPAPEMLPDSKMSVPIQRP